MAASLFQELKRRNVFKATTGYLVLGWLVLQIADVVVPALNLPEWTLTLLVVIGAFGLPFVIFFSWAFELTPDGIKREIEVNRDESLRNETGQKLNYVIIALLVLALGYFLYERQTLRPESKKVSEAQASSSNEVANQNNIPTIAVLPLLNMSADADNAFFAGGVHEDILTNLSRIESFKVISRTSVMRFINSDQDIKSIAQSLGADYVLEGSVRKINNYVRVTVQLIDADDDSHLWANNYDRELIDVFATQSAIAQEITDSVHLTIQPDTFGNQDDRPTHSIEAYDHYLQAMSIIRSEAQTEESLQRTWDQLEEAVKDDPDFVEAWAFLNEILDEVMRTVDFEGWFIPPGPKQEEQFEALRQRAVVALKKAVALDPENEYTLIARASGITGENDLESEDADVFSERKAVMDYTLEKFPESAYGWYVIGWWYNLARQHENASQAFEKSLALDPFNAKIVLGSLSHYRTIGDQEQVDRLYKRLTEISPDTNEQKFLGKTYPLMVHFSLIMQFAQTGDASIIEPIRSFIGSNEYKALPELLRLIVKYQYTRLFGGDFTRSELDSDYAFIKAYKLGMLSVEKEEHGFYQGNEAYSYLLAFNLIRQEYLQRGATDEAFEVAQKIAEKAQLVYQHPDNERMHTILVSALQSLERFEEARTIVDDMLRRRGLLFDPYGMSSHLALSYIDIDDAVKRILADKASQPSWRTTDIMVIYHEEYRHIISHPEMQAYYRKEGKWVNYLAQYVPEYQK